jgi:G3E family GTPase
MTKGFFDTLRACAMQAHFNKERFMIKIDVISGFLGAGKTTFANMLLSHYATKKERAVYIVNEFGQTSIDAELMQGAGFQAVALPGGCICCTLKGELTLALKEIIQTFEPSRIIFETSGIFVFNQFEDILQDEFLRKHCVIRRAVVIVDSLSYKSAGLIAGSFIENQIKNASVIVVSKLERFEGDAAEMVCDLKNVNPKAIVVAKQWSEDGFLDSVLVSKGQGLGCAFGHGHAHMDAVTLPIDKNLDWQVYDRLIQRIISGEFGKILRVKGFLQIEGVWYLLNIAMRDVVLKQTAQCGEARMTFIGNHLDKTQFEQLLTA